MDIIRIIGELQAERERIESAIAILERIGSGKRRGRPPKWTQEGDKTASAGIGKTDVQRGSQTENVRSSAAASGEWRGLRWPGEAWLKTCACKRWSGDAHWSCIHFRVCFLASLLACNGPELCDAFSPP